MPWGYRSVSKSRHYPTSEWNTAGQTASLKNACAQYGLSEEDVRKADPPIACQWRSCHGNSYAVVKLSDMRALKSRLDAAKKEAAKQKLIEELGEEGYAKKIEEEKRKKEADEAARRLVPLLEAAMNASGHGIEDTLVGMSIGKTAAKTEWYVKPDEIAKLAPVDPTKKLAKYHLADVIDVAHNKRNNNGDHISFRVKSCSKREKLYARYLHDKFHVQCNAVGDETIVQKAYDEVRGKIAKEVSFKAAAAKKAKDDLAMEEKRLAAFDGLVEDMKSGGGDKKVAAKAKGDSPSSKENTENDNDTKPAAKKRKVTKKGLQEATSTAAAASGRSGGRVRKVVSYADADSENEEE